MVLMQDELTRRMNEKGYNVKVMEAPKRLIRNAEIAAKRIKTFSEKATIPICFFVYMTSKDMVRGNLIDLAFSDNSMGLNIIIVSPTILKYSDETIIATFIHELIHFTSEGCTFLDIETNEAFTELCSSVIQKKYLLKGEKIYEFDVYSNYVQAVSEAIRDSGIPVEIVVDEFLNKDTNKFFMKRNFPQLYRCNTLEALAVYWFDN